MIELRKTKTTKEMTSLLSQYLQNDFNSSIGTYEGNDFLLLEGCSEKEKIEEFLSNYIDSNGFVYSSLDSLFSSNYGFSDEYTICYGCNNIICLTPGYYEDQPKYHVFNEACEILCKDCIDIEELIENVKNDPKKCIKRSLFTTKDIEDQGFILLNNKEYQNGLHAGMNDDPQKIFDQFKNKYSEIVFFLNETSQFYIEFLVYGRNKEE